MTTATTTPAAISSVPSNGADKMRKASKADKASAELAALRAELAALKATSAPSADPSTDAIAAEVARLRAENEALRKARTSTVSMKVSEKGALSVYGLGRFPVTLYAQQWQKLLSLAESIKGFIEAHKSDLSWKE
jgi:hypothetical protein